MNTFSTFFISATLMVTSINFSPNGMIPEKYSCEGTNTNPALHVENLPKGTASLAIIIHDPDAPKKGGFTHWVAWNISPMADIPENYTGGVQGRNDAQTSGYTGPCPPSGTHHYHFKVYALDTKLTLDKDSGKAGLERAMRSHILAEGELIGLYKKSK
jgi:Raf kinase inhibitor-like YbhB/YbcL family protein